MCFLVAKAQALVKTHSNAQAINNIIEMFVDLRAIWEGSVQIGPVFQKGRTLEHENSPFE